MDQELRLQEQCFENIKSLCENYRKDSAGRKTVEYLTKRISSLENQWKDFETRHVTLQQLIEDKSMNYFSEDVFGKTKKLCDNTLLSMQQKLSELTDEQKPPTFEFSDIFFENDSSDEPGLLQKQSCNIKAIERTISKIDVSQLNEKWELEQKLAALKSRWEAVDNQHWEVDAQLKGTKKEQYNQLYNKIEEKYEKLQGELSRKIWANSHYENAAPKIVIPEFSGSYTQWISFKDLFEETIHNNPRINAAQKMQHLKTKLRGEAEKLVQHLPISAENYASCWEILSQRYDNRRLQFTSYLNTMMGLPVIQTPEASNLKRMHDVIYECLNGLSNIGVDTIALGSTITHLMLQKLDDKTFDEYSKEIQEPRELPSMTEFLDFLESKFMAYETKKRVKKEQSTTQKPTFNFRSKPSFNKQFAAKNYEERKQFQTTYLAMQMPCPYCHNSHVLMQCPKFIDMNPIQRSITVAKLNLCRNCLFSHGNKQCASTKKCKECNLGHHTLLHNYNWKINATRNQQQNKLNQEQATASIQSQSANHLSNDDVEVLLTTVQLQVQAMDGSYVTLRALLDQGSQVSLITESAAQLLRLPRKKLYATISGLGAVSGECKGHLQLTCKSIYSDYTFEIDTMIMRKLTNNLPSSSFKKREWPHLESLKLADPEYHISRPVDLLLGADVYSDVIMEGILKANTQAPIAQQTRLGWILCGKMKTLSCHVAFMNTEEIVKFWETEDITPGDNDVAKSDQCEQYYSTTTQRASDGRYIVKMPFCPNYDEKLGKSKSIAVAQFLQLEKRLEKSKKLAAMYRQFVEEYIEMGHMKESLPLPNSTSTLECYLPHHGVLREHSTTTKLRVVFNASQNTTTGCSLNSLQEKGLNLQKDIQALILKWRSYKYAFTADIEKMYRCIWIHEDQQQLQKIIWRDSPTKPLREYQLCTVTYGMKSAPWLALRTLQQLAADDGHKYPAAANTLKHEFYVDDLISGHNSLEEAKNLQKSLINLLNGGGMNLRKWSSNSSELLETLHEEQISTKKLFDFKSEDSMKTLGLSWNPNEDTFLFNWDLKPQQQENQQITKRQLLSEISQLYDPLGWVAPITVTAKLLFQRVWTTKLDWNDALPSEIQQDWIKFKTDLPQLKNIKLNRWIGGGSQNMQLLGFCDASERAYACVVYSRIINENGQPIITLLASKTRVAPLSQKLTLPRLELCGALLLSQLMEKITSALAGRKITTRAWCDSQVVLAWLQGDATRWEKYVANRVNKIKQVIPAEKWQYIRSEDNPADCASRGMYPSKLMNYDLWWNGAKLLQTQNDENLTCHYTTHLGQIKTTPKSTCERSKLSNEHFIDELLRNHSSITRVTRVVTWVLRFSACALNKRLGGATYLTASELIEARELITKHIQRTEFETEYNQLLKNSSVDNKSHLNKLNPYIDEKGILRVGGRLSKSNLPADMKNPAILSRHGRLTNLIIEQAHLRTLHGGARLTLAYIRQHYWIISGNRTVKAQLRNCVRCHRLKPTENYQLMGDLPRQRVTPSRPFTHTGVDFTGHVEVKLNKGRGVKTSKGYIAIFVCMATKAVHIELVSDLSAETLIAAFQRMCARRGTPKHMYSDCGTNFIGAARKLSEEFQDFQQLLSPEFFAEIGKLEVEWHFNAPAWPSGGGLWEAAVKAMKHHLRRVLGDQKLTYEEFSTLLSQIEACLNSRPLCPLTENPEEFNNYLTPGHFLTGSPTMSLPRADHSDARCIDIRRRWKLSEHMIQQFWKNWSNEYLSQLQTRSKWHKPTRNIKEGDIVLIKGDNMPPGKWALGRVLQIHPGSDGLVRVATVKCQSGIIKRPIMKLSPLPAQDEQTEPENKLESNDQPKKQRINSRKTNSKTAGSYISTIMMCLFIFATMITESYSYNVTSGARITTFESRRPVYYDAVGRIQMIHDEWTLLLYYNLTSYWSGIKRIETYLAQVNSWCQKTDPLYCGTTISQLSHEMEILDHYNQILLSPHKHISERKKRGLIDGVGTIANSLFGILDQRFAEKYSNDIDAIHENEHYLLELVKNQTSIVELENDILAKTETNINQQLTSIDKFMNQTNENYNKVKSTLEIVMATSYFNSASLSAYLLINNLKKIQELLFDALTNIYKGHMDIQLLSPVKLINQINEISGHLPKTTSLPIDDVRRDIKDLYKLISLKARVTSSHFLFEVHIPLVTDEDFALYRVVPIPIVNNDETIMIKLSSNYIAVDMRKSIYMSLLESHLQLCTKIKKDTFICNKNLPVHNLNNNNAPCEAKLLSHQSNLPCPMRRTVCQDTWQELHAPNSWLIICCDVCNLRAICVNDITTYVMKTGIVNIAQGCVLQSKDTTIYTRNVYSSNINMDLDYNLPAVNFSINKLVNLPSYNITKLSESAELNEVGKKLLMQKENEYSLPSTISGHDVHHYVLLYILVGVVAGVIIVWSVRTRRLTRVTPPKATYDVIELQTRGPQKPPRQCPAEYSSAETAVGSPEPQGQQPQGKKIPSYNVAFNLEDLP